MKRYIVFLKQVPLSTKVEMDPVTKTLKRSSALSQVNPDDLYALQAALDLRRSTGAEVIAVSMGPLSAEVVLREAIQRGADRAILLSSPAFAGSDTWCTSLVLASAVRKIGEYDILFFGRIAIDGDTAQVGPEVAGHLNIPQVTQLVNVESCTDKYIRLFTVWDENIAPAGELARLCVREDMQNQGIAKEMMRYAFDALKEQGKKGVHILVRKGHAGAIACYTALGFQQVGECSLFEKEFICMEREL